MSRENFFRSHQNSFSSRGNLFLSHGNDIIILFGQLGSLPGFIKFCSGFIKFCSGSMRFCSGAGKSQSGAGKSHSDILSCSWIILKKPRQGAFLMWIFVHAFGGLRRLLRRCGAGNQSSFFSSSSFFAGVWRTRSVSIRVPSMRVMRNSNVCHFTVSPAEGMRSSTSSIRPPTVL